MATLPKREAYMSTVHLFMRPRRALAAKRRSGLDRFGSPALDANTITLCISAHRTSTNGILVPVLILAPFRGWA